MRPRPRHLVALLLAATVGACATLQQIAALRQVSFSLAGVRDARLAGVSLDRIASYRDLTATEVGRLGLALTRNDLPFEFLVNVRAENPAENRTTATMVRLTWSLLLDDKETLHGVLDTSHVLPPGQPVVIPLLMRMNLREFFGGSAESLVNLAVGLAGLNADPTRVALRAVPTIDTPVGPIEYPSPIAIISGTVGTSRP